MFDIKDILEPKTLEEALEIKNNNDVEIIAGGTDILIKLHHNQISDITLLSLQNIDKLKEIYMDEKKNIIIGAMASFTSVFRDEIINENIYALAEAAVSMGGPQVRNVATIGGNVCNGAVSADSATTLFAFNAKLKLETFEGFRIIPIEEFYLGPGRVAINKNEILTEIIIEEENYKDYFSHYIKFSNRKAMDIAMLGVSINGKFSKGIIEDIRIALGVAAPTPIRCKEAEEYSKNKEITIENIEEVAKKTLLDARPRNSWRGSKDFRTHLIKELSKRGILEILKKGGVEVNE